MPSQPYCSKPRRMVLEMHQLTLIATLKAHVWLRLELGEAGEMARTRKYSMAHRAWRRPNPHSSRPPSFAPSGKPTYDGIF